MRTTTHGLLVLSISALLVGSAVAQRSETRETPAAPQQATPTRTQREQAAQEGTDAARRRAADEAAKAQRAAQGTQAEQRERAAQAERAGQTGHADRAATGGQSAADAAEMRHVAAEIAHQETEHRARTAKLKRLKELAEQAKQPDRVKAIDELQRTEMRNHERHMTQLKAKLDGQEKAAVERAVNHGREAAAHTTAERRKALQEWERQHPGRSHGVERSAHARSQPGATTRPGADQAQDRNTRPQGQQEHARDGKQKSRSGGRDG